VTGVQTCALPIYFGERLEDVGVAGRQQVSAEKNAHQPSRNGNSVRFDGVRVAYAESTSTVRGRRDCGRARRCFRAYRRRRRLCTSFADGGTCPRLGSRRGRRMDSNTPSTPLPHLGSSFQRVHHGTRRSASAAICPSSRHPLGSIGFLKGDNSLPFADGEARPLSVDDLLRVLHSGAVGQPHWERQHTAR